MLIFLPHGVCGWIDEIEIDENGYKLYTLYKYTVTFLTEPTFFFDIKEAMQKYGDKDWEQGRVFQGFDEI